MLLADFREENKFKLMGMQATISEKKDLLERLDQQILTLTEDEIEIETDIDRASEVKLIIN